MTKYRIIKKEMNKTQSNKIFMIKDFKKYKTYE